MSAYAVLDLDGVEGESILKNFENKIDILSHSWGLSMPTSLGSGTGGGVSRANFQDLTLMKSTDKATPNIFLGCASGQHFTKATFTLLKAGGGDPVEFLKYELEDVMVTSHQTSDAANSTSLPSESLSLAYNKITLTYTPQGDSGSGDSPTPIGWDVAANTKV